MHCAWYKRSSVDYTQMIPLAEENNPEKFEAMELFAYPEQSVEGELLFRMFDYTHILTNMRSHILTRGYDYCKKEDFEWIVDNTTGILSRYLVQYKMDAQNAFSAMKMYTLHWKQMSVKKVLNLLD